MKINSKDNQLIAGWTLVDMKDTNTNDELIIYGSILELLSTESSFCQKVSLFFPLSFLYNFGII